jgi:hypothetical protein
MAKRAVNQTLDAMGFSNAIESCFDMHRRGHARGHRGQDRGGGDLDRMKAAGRSK